MKVAPLGSIHSGLLGKSLRVVRREGITSYPLTHLAYLIDLLPAQYWTVEDQDWPPPFLSILRQSGGRAH